MASSEGRYVQLCMALVAVWKRVSSLMVVPFELPRISLSVARRLVQLELSRIA
jgi:hypothetical protein